MARLLRKPAPSPSLDWSDIGRLLLDLERGLSQLSTFMSGRVREVGGAIPERVRDASSAIPDRLSDTLSEISDRLRVLMRDNRHVGEEAMRMSQGALQRIEREVVDRPLVALAVAAGIGFLIGALNRRDQ
jgi:ElaB/YqjD/DUF883 family membrane-anchored ribosome-binding protein